MSLRFNKLKFVKKLQEANHSSEMAGALADALDEALEQSQSQFVTKSDFNQGITELKTEFKQELSQLEIKLTASMYMVGIIFAGISVLMSLIKSIHLPFC